MPVATAIYGTVTDVYLAAQGLPSMSGLKLGMYYFEQSAQKTYRLLKATATIANNKACTFDPSTNIDTAVVKASDAASQSIAGLNNTGSAVAVNDHFWGLVHGAGTVIMAAGIAAGNMLVTGTTSGQLEAAAAGVSTPVVATAAPGGAGAATTCFISTYKP